MHVCLQCACESCNSNVFSNIQYPVFHCKCTSFPNSPIHASCMLHVCAIDKDRVHILSFIPTLFCCRIQTIHLFIESVSSFWVGGNNNDVRLKFVVSAYANVFVCLCVCVCVLCLGDGFWCIYIQVPHENVAFVSVWLHHYLAMYALNSGFVAVVCISQVHLLNFMRSEWWWRSL